MYMSDIEHISDVRVAEMEKRMDLLSRITSQTHTNLDHQIETALELTTDLLGVDAGLISSVSNQIYTIRWHYPETLNCTSGQKFDLSTTYCSIALDYNKLVAIEHMERSDYCNHPCYELFEMESYIGIPIKIDGRVYGTLNFTGKAPKESEFLDADKTFVQLLSQWVASTIKRKQIEDRLLQQNKKLRKLTSTRKKLYSIIGHDLRGAFSGIKGLLSIIIEDIKDDQETDDVLYKLNLTQMSAENAFQLLENLLDWVRMQSENLDPDLRDTDIKKVLNNSMNLLQSGAEKKDITFKVKYTDPNIISGDDTLLAIVFRNLLSNAIKFSEEGSEILVSTEVDENNLLVRIQDFGMGMTEEIRYNLFNPTSRPKRPGTAHEQGSGLGLLLVKEMVEIHNGTIDVISTEGKGTEFIIALPFS